MPENPKHHPPKVPLGETTPSLKQFCCGLLLTSLVFCPRVTSVSARLGVLQVMVLLPPLVRNKTRENENGFNPQFFEGAQV